MTGKRLFDIAAAGSLALLLLPLMVLTALWIRIDSRGPAIFRQERVGLGGTPFKIFKFRTMFLNTGSERLGVTVGEDSRVTRVGRWLRAYKLDELPQLFNVIRGDMSLVGPRPELQEFVAYWTPEEAEVILSVRPGITDFASIEYRGEDEILGRSDDPLETYIEEVMPAKRTYYIDYVKNRTFGVDLEILLETALALLGSSDSLRSVGILFLAVLALVQCLLAYMKAPPALTAATLLLTALIAASIYSRTHVIAPVADLAFILGVLAYAMTPWLLSLISDYSHVPTLSTQQAIAGATLATFVVLRSVLSLRLWGRTTQSVAAARQAHILPSVWPLLVVTGLGVILALPSIRQHMAMEYGMRTVDQRTPHTIALLSLFYFGLAISLAFLRKQFVTKRHLFWGISSCLVLLSLGILNVMVFSTRTSLIWACALIVPSLVVHFRFRLRIAVLVVAAALVCVPILNLIGIARSTDKSGERRSLKTAVGLASSDSLADMLRQLELVKMSEHAERMYSTYGDDRLLGKYIVTSVLQAPPAFVLRWVGFEPVRSLKKDFALRIDPVYYARGGGFALSMAGEAYVNFGLIGGVVSGLLLFLFVQLMEAIAVGVLPSWASIVVMSSFAISVARVNRSGIESLPKQILIHVVFIVLTWLAVRFSTLLESRKWIRPSD